MNTSDQPGETSPEDATPTSIREFILEYLQGLSDLQFKIIVTTRMLPTIYVLGIVVAAIATIGLTINGFRESLGSGLVWVCLLGPALLIATVTAWRVILELCFGFFQLIYMLQNMTGVVDKISGQTDQIGDAVEQVSSDLPRITFWRSKKK